MGTLSVRSRVRDPYARFCGRPGLKAPPTRFLDFTLIYIIFIKRPVGISWRMDETYIKVKGQLVYLYRAVDKEGKTVDFMLSEKRDDWC